eukprot:TRINITY_DN10084_c0_g1_i1.p2 TRINITY_DN10084_c0_g1~~TRINITY_DN10084_c0_g1_i1.p2  ORF type:complete len:205 (-),score=41.64 TRINITY_DN10084_c0_g1_i1:1258-1872(-)
MQETAQKVQAASAEPRSRRKASEMSGSGDDQKQGRDRADRLLRNRESAKLCRLRKKQRMETLESQVEDVQRVNSELQRVAAQVTAENTYLKQILGQYATLLPREVRDELMRRNFLDSAGVPQFYPPLAVPATRASSGLPVLSSVSSIMPKVHPAAAAAPPLVPQQAPPPPPPQQQPSPPQSVPQSIPPPPTLSSPAAIAVSQMS